METQRIEALESTFSRHRPVRTLIHIFDGNWGSLAVAAGLFIIKHSPVWVLPMAVAGIINVVTSQGHRPITDLYRYLAIVFFFVIQNIPSHVLFIRFFSRGVRNTEARLRSALVRKMQQLTIAFHDDFKSGRLHSKVLRDVESVEMLATQFMKAVLPALLGIGISFFVTIRREPIVALFFVGTVPVAAALIHTFRKKVKDRNAEYRTEMEVMSAKVSEMIEMIPVTRAHGAESTEIERMKSQLERVRDRGIRLDVLNALFTASSWVSFEIFHIVSLLFTGTLAYRGRIPIGDVVMYQSFFMMIVGGIEAMLNIYPILTRGFESVNSMAEILECPDIEQNRGKRRVRQVKGDITFEHVDLVYDEKAGPAVHDFSLSVAGGETVAVIGESGSGKTSVMNLIVGFRRPTRGRILLDGIDMQELDLRDFRQFLSVVSQNTVLFSGSIRDNITYGLTSVTDDRLAEIVRLANVAEFAEKMPDGLDTLIGEHGARLSGGQRQRIAIARALVRDPRVIIFDEATSALDVVSEALVQEAIEHLIKGRTTFIVAHRLSTIRHAGRIVVLRDGRIVEQGTHQSLLDGRGEYHRMKNLQVA